MSRNFIYLVLSFFLFSCGGTKRASQYNLAKEYKKETGDLIPSFRLFTGKKSEASLFFSVSREELLFSRTQPNEKLKARIRILVVQKAGFEAESILDSVSTFIEYPEDLTQSLFTGEVKFQPKPSAGLISIRFTDENKNASVNWFASYSGENVFSKFIPFVAETGTPVMERYISGSYPLKISGPENSDSVLVRYYNREFPIAPSPYSASPKIPFDFRPDSTFTYLLGSEIVFSKPGIYQFVTDTSKKTAFTILKFYNDFPHIRKPEHLVNPLRYILVRKEYEEITGKPDAKLAVDEFWVDVTGNDERAVEVIRKYYGRVETANHLFTSYQEGWKTDRGMIYIVLGPPKYVYRGSTTETWYYSEDQMNPSTTFRFQKITNPFCDNDYLLDRTPLIKQLWYQAIESWREGRMYYEN